MRWTTQWVVGCLLLSVLSYACAPSARRSNPSRGSSLSVPPARVAPSPSTLQSDLAVRQVQGVLHEQGYDPGPIDGLMGDKTRAALRQFQLDHQLPATGRIDAATKAALLQ